MGRPNRQSPSPQWPNAAGSLLIAIGIAALLASMWLPNMPVVTAMAVLTLGATDATLARYRRSPALPVITLTHAAVYLSLYSMFIGATLHVPSVALSHGLVRGAVIDLAASILPMAIAVQHMAGTLHLHVDQQQ